MANPYGLSGSGTYVKVTTEELCSRAGEAEASINNIKSSFEKLVNMMEGTSGYWEGEAGTLYRSTYRKQNEVIQEILKNIQEYPAKLLQIAGVYETSESANAVLASDLETNLL